MLIPNPISDWLFAYKEETVEQQVAQRVRNRSGVHNGISFNYPINPIQAEISLNFANEEMASKNFKIIHLDKSNDPYLVKNPIEKRKNPHKFMDDINSGGKLKKKKLQLKKSSRELASRNRELSLREYYEMQLDINKKLGY